MPNEFSISGASSSKKSRYTGLYNSYFASGLCTQRNPLRPGNESALTNRIYGSKNDSLLAGSNVEISNRLTMVRRPGSSVYNSQTFPTIDSFYEFKSFDNDNENIKVIADTSSIIYDATGPTTKATLFTKSAGAGQAYFQSVGNNLYIGDGVDQVKYLQPAKTWQPSTVYQLGDLILDSNGNLQQAFSIASVLSIASIQQFTTLNAVNLSEIFVRVVFLTPMDFPSQGLGTITLSGLTGATWLNGATVDLISPIGASGTMLQGEVMVSHADYGPAPETGTATGITTSGSGTSGTTQPTWSTNDLDLTTDGQLTWKNFGPPVEAWGLPAPLNPPVVARLYNTEWYWQANFDFASFPNQGFYQSVIDSNQNIQSVFTHSGNFHTGFVQPTWNPTKGGLTPDGGLVWTNCGQLTSWFPNFALGQYTAILDSNQNIQVCIGINSPGLSGATQPTWNMTLGGSTNDNNLTWTNCGPGTILATGTYQYSYSFHAIDGSVSAPSPVDSSVVNGVLGYSFPGFGIRLFGSAQFGLPADVTNQIDEIWVWRTTQGGSVSFLLATLPVDSLPPTWTYLDYSTDTQLNPQIQAPINDSASEPPNGLTKMTYHLGRIWGAVNNSVYFSGGPDTTTGNGNTVFPPANVFVFPDKVNRLFASILGLFVFTNADIYVIQGTTTTNFYSAPFAIGVGLPNYNAFAVNGSTPYFFTSDGQMVSIDMSGGVTEVGFNIGDQFLKSNWNQQTLQVTYHISGSTDKGLYVSDFANGWFRMYPTPSPEAGTTWTPFASIVGGCSAVQSIETTPGVHNLLIGPKTSGPILKRDDSVFTDNGQPYDANFLFGSIVVAQPGQLAELVFITTDSIATGSRPTISVQLDEIAPFSAGMFEPLPLFVPDPPQLTTSTSMYSDRRYFSQSQQPALGRNLQIYFDWGTDAVQNELLSLTVFGGFSTEL